VSQRCGHSAACVEFSNETQPNCSIWLLRTTLWPFEQLLGQALDLKCPRILCNLHGRRNPFYNDYEDLLANVMDLLKTDVATTSHHGKEALETFIGSPQACVVRELTLCLPWSGPKLPLIALSKQSDEISIISGLPDAAPTLENCS
jgi:hypothetical protein